MLNNSINEIKEKLLALKASLFNIRMELNQNIDVEQLNVRINDLLNKVHVALEKLGHLEITENAQVLGSIKVGIHKFVFSRVVKLDNITFGYINEFPCLWWGETDENGCPLPFAGKLERDIERMQEFIAPHHHYLSLEQQDGAYQWVIHVKKTIKP